MSGAAGCPPRPAEAYIAEAVEQECARVLEAPPHEANNTLNQAAFNLGTMEGAGPINRDLAAHRGQGPAMRKISRRMVRYDRVEFEAWLEAQSVDSCDGAA
jgi:hypothetical protein